MAKQDSGGERGGGESTNHLDSRETTIHEFKSKNMVEIDWKD